MWYFGTWSSGGIGSVTFMVVLDLQVVFQPALFYDSMKRK